MLQICAARVEESLPVRAVQISMHMADGIWAFNRPEELPLHLDPE